MLQPLAYRMRPRQLEDILGQEHLVGPGKIIHRMVQAKRLTSMILYGPPGIGKTSIASAIAGSTRYAFRTLNAATDGKKELEQVVEEAKFSGTLILKHHQTRFPSASSRKWSDYSDWGDY